MKHKALCPFVGSACALTPWSCLQLEVVEAALISRTTRLEAALMEVEPRVAMLLELLPNKLTADALEELRLAKQALVRHTRTRPTANETGSAPLPTVDLSSGLLPDCMLTTRLLHSLADKSHQGESRARPFLVRKVPKARGVAFLRDAQDAEASRGAWSAVRSPPTGASPEKAHSPCHLCMPWPRC